MLFLYNLTGKVALSAIEKETAKKRISEFFEQRFKFSINKKIHINLPAIIGQDKHKIKAYISYMIEGYKIPRYIKNFLKANIMITFKAQPNVKVLLCNNISFGKKWDFDKHTNPMKKMDIYANAKKLHKNTKYR